MYVHELTIDNEEIKNLMKLGGMTALLLLLPIINSHAGAGATSAEFLLLTNGARPSAMAGAFTGVADDVHTLSINPAGLGRIDHIEASFMHSEWLVDTSYEFGSFVQPLAFGTYGISLTYLDAGDITGRGNMGQKTNDFTASDMVLTFGYGFKATEEMYVGFTGKYINQTIDDASRNGAAIDAGLLWEINPERLYTGLAINNIGPKLSAFDSDEETLPTVYRMGVGYYAIEKKLLVASDIKSIVHGKPSLSIGIEYLIKTILFLRSGLTAGSEMDNSLTWTGGMGFTFGGYHLDYCYEPFGDLDSTHKIAFVVKF